MWGRRRETAWQKDASEADDDAVRMVDTVLGRIPLVPPWTVSEFTAWVESEYGRSVQLVPWPDDERPQPGEPGECGLLITTPSTFIISFDERTSERHMRQQIFHEFGHILCGHEAARHSASGPSPASSLVAGIDPAMIQYVLHRGIFEREEERVAEMVGTCLAVLSRRQNGHARFDRIASAFYEPIKK